MEQFNLEYQYQEYLKKVKLNESQMSPVQKKETRQAFMGACGVMLILLRDEVSKFEEDKAIEIMQGMFDQVGDYFLKDRNRFN